MELSPTRIRTIGQSVTVVGGRIGASSSAFLFPPLLGVLGETGVIGLLAAVSVVGDLHAGGDPGDGATLAGGY